MKSLTFKNNLRKYTILSSILLLSLSGIIVYATFPNTGPSSVNKSLLPINVFNSLISNSCGSNSGPIASISSIGGVTCGKNPNFTSGISNNTSGGITFPTSGPGGSTAGTLMTAFKNFLNSTCPSGEYIVGTKADGSKACSISSPSSVANLTIPNQGISYPASGLSGANKNGTIGAKLSNFFNSTCSSNQYLAGINSNGNKICSPKPVDGGWTVWSPSSCPTACGQPASSLTRTCTNPVPAYGGSDCVGSSTSSCPATASCTNYCTAGGTSPCTATGSTTTTLCSSAPDITLSNGQTWKACNVGATIVGTGSDSYGNYYTYNQALTACPSGYHLPSQSEWQSAYNVYSSWILGDQNHLPTVLKLPLAGYYFTIPDYYRGIGYGYSWSSTSISINNAYYMSFTNSFSDPTKYMGSNNYLTVRCIKDGTSIPVNGSCGSANGTSVSTVPTTNLCTTGTASVVSGTGPWAWFCVGSNGGITAGCSANVNIPQVYSTTTIGPIGVNDGGSGFDGTCPTGYTLYGIKVINNRMTLNCAIPNLNNFNYYSTLIVGPTGVNDGGGGWEGICPTGYFINDFLLVNNTRTMQCIKFGPNHTIVDTQQIGPTGMPDGGAGWDAKCTTGYAIKRIKVVGNQLSLECSNY